MHIVGILLAAGSGSRFGGDKLLARLPGGEPVGVAAWRKLHAAVPDSIVVVRAGDETLKDALTGAGAQIVECKDANLGMSKSLIAGILATEQAQAWIVALGDMPYLRTETIGEVAGALTRGALIAMPEYRGTRGHPVGFSAALRRELLAIVGDEGARSVTGRHAQEVVVIETQDPGIALDIDTRADLHDI